MLIFTGACVPQRKTIYIQDQGKELPLKVFEVNRAITETIQPGDELYIRVTTSDERPTNFTESAPITIDVTLASYTVGDDGTIKFPYLGTVNVHGKTLAQVSDEIEDALGSYVSSPSVNVLFVNKNITVIGEVGSPGVYIFYDKNINILQAIAHAGDIGTFGNKKHVVLLREENGKLTKYRLDLTDEKILASSLYIVKSNDIVYVEPLRIKKWGFETFPYTLVITLLNTTLFLWTFALTTLY